MAETLHDTLIARIRANIVLDGALAANIGIGIAKVVAAGINGTGIDSADDLLGRLSQTEDGAVLDLGGGNAVLLFGVSASAVTASDFDIV